MEMNGHMLLNVGIELGKGGKSMNMSQTSVMNNDKILDACVIKISPFTTQMI